jgi:hypothetical protein
MANFFQEKTLRYEQIFISSILTSGNQVIRESVCRISEDQHTRKKLIWYFAILILKSAIDLTLTHEYLFILSAHKKAHAWRVGRAAFVSLYLWPGFGLTGFCAGAPPPQPPPLEGTTGFGFWGACGFLVWSAIWVLLISRCCFRRPHLSPDRFSSITMTAQNTI